MDLIPRKRSEQASSVANGAHGSEDAPVPETVVRGTEIALTTLVFFGIGWLIDLAADTKPWFTVSLVVACLVGQFVRIKAEYNTHMARLEAERAELARRRPLR